MNCALTDAASCSRARDIQSPQSRYLWAASLSVTLLQLAYETAIVTYRVIGPSAHQQLLMLKPLREPFRNRLVEGERLSSVKVKPQQSFRRTVRGRA